MSSNVKELKSEKQKWDNFKTIMKIVELNEINKLFKMTQTFNNNLVYFHEQKKLMKKIEVDLSLRNKSKFFNRKKENVKKSSGVNNKYLYIVMSPQKNDLTTKAMLAKMREYLSNLDKENNYFITFGHEANKMCNRLELKIVDSFKQFNTDSSEKDSISKIVAISSLSIANSIFEDVHIVFPEINSEKGDLFVTKILPFSENSEEFAKELSEAEELIEKRSSTLVYDGNIRQIQWFPSVDSVYANLVESLIQLKINMIILKHKIILQKELVAQTRDKNKKIQEQIDELKIFIQSRRREEITLELLILATSFKVLKKDAEEFLGFDKKDLDEEVDLLWKKEIERKIKDLK
ncbi:MAG: F0F1 ATP synthase subunit gamma [Mycoplasmatales bacterium]|nr:F0F1 ATP synthase subunit gamma [Mycoplasmatales bacterium]